MKKLLVLAAAVAATGVANAKLTGDLRVDYTRPTTKSGSADSVTSSRYSVQTADLAYVGAVGAGMTVNAKLLVATTPSVDYVYGSKSIVDGLTLRIGLIRTFDGGIEDSYLAVDQYTTTHINGLALGNAGGFGLDYVMGDHSFTLENFNNTTSTGGDKNGTVTGLVYKGSLLEKMIKPHVSYYAGSAEGLLVKDIFTSTLYTGVRGSEYTAAAVGAQFAVGMGVGIDAEYKSVGYNKFQNSSDKYTETGFTLAAAMTDGMFQPAAKFGTSEGKYDTGSVTSKQTYTTMAVGLNIVPKKDEGFRYHVAYASTEQKPETGDKSTSTALVAGVKMSADFLK